MQSSAQERFQTLLEQRLEPKNLALPLLPATASRVLQSCAEENCDARSLAQLVQADMALAANVLRIANSAASGAREPIVSLQQAISRMGLATLCSLAVAAATKTEIFRCAGWERWLKDLWAHSTRSGAWAKEVARLRRKNVEGAFLSGLMHDVGRALILKEASALAQAEQFTLTPSMVTDWCDALHARVGAELLQAWSMPVWAASAVREHHVCLNQVGASEEALTVALADALAHATASGQEQPGVREELTKHPALEALSIYADDLDLLLERRTEVQKLVDALG